MLGHNTTAIYLAVAYGKVVRRFKEPTATSKERITKTGKVVHEETYDYVQGHLTGIDTRENEFGKFWMLQIADGPNKYILQFQYSGGNASSFLKAIPNADLTRPIKFIPRQQLDGDKKRSSIVMVQGDQAIRWYWTKETPRDLPQLRKVKIKGKEQWDDSDMMEYLESYLKENIIPKLLKAAEPVAPAFGAEAADDEESVPF